jgi:hypothetical protein
VEELHVAQVGGQSDEGDKMRYKYRVTLAIYFNRKQIKI